MLMGWGINYDSQWRRSKRKETEKQKEAAEKMQREKRGAIVVEERLRERLGLGGRESERERATRIDSSFLPSDYFFEP
ncbi:hypothetical protein DPV78_000449 [Talaromyces pinophilus]|nr:hypothetical protein DPV78_000449 [Talaromyces pinophilus]